MNFEMFEFLVFFILSIFHIKFQLQFKNNYINTSNVYYREEEGLTLSQLPVVDLGEDFDFIEEIENSNTSMNKNEDKNEEKVNIQERKQVTLEAWSKGHVTGLKVKF